MNYKTRNYAKKVKVIKEKSLEDKIWESANKLRGNLTASEYQNVVLGLIFLKYISDCFDKRYQELVDEGDGFEEDRDEYTAEHAFWVPQEARWRKIANMRRLVKRLLKKYKYPPEKAQDALETVLRQCEQWAEEEELIDNEPNLFATRVIYAFGDDNAMPMAAETPS